MASPQQPQTELNPSKQADSTSSSPLKAESPDDEDRRIERASLATNIPKRLTPEQPNVAPRLLSPIPEDKILAISTTSINNSTLNSLGIAQTSRSESAKPVPEPSGRALTSQPSPDPQTARSPTSIPLDTNIQSPPSPQKSTMANPPSTSGSSSGSGTATSGGNGYPLPYAPFPFPLPPSGSQGGQQGGQGRQGR